MLLFDGMCLMQREVPKRKKERVGFRSKGVGFGSTQVGSSQMKDLIFRVFFESGLSSGLLRPNPLSSLIEGKLFAERFTVLCSIFALYSLFISVFRLYLW